MDDGEYADLIESVYLMALEPDLWPALVDRLAATFGGHAGALMQENMESGAGGSVSRGLDDATPGLYFNYYANRNILRRLENPRERMRAFEPTITVDEEIIPKRDLMRSEFYSDFLRPAGIHSVMTMGLWAQGVDVSALDVYRPAGRPGFSSADVDLAAGLHPHLVRAFRLSQKLADTRVVNDGLAAALDRAPYGLFILDADRRVRHVNAAGERMLAQPGGLGVLGGRLVAAAPGDTRRLEALIATAASGAGSRVGGSMIVRRPDGRAPLSVTTSPADAGPLSLFRSGPTVVVCVTDPEQAASVSEAQLREVFGLTPGQAKVAVALLEGRSAREAADALGLSFFTVRAHLARIFEKTGVNRQAELVALMTRMTGLTTD